MKLLRRNDILDAPRTPSFGTDLTLQKLCHKGEILRSSRIENGTSTFLLASPVMASNCTFSTASLAPLTISASLHILMLKSPRLSWQTPGVAMRLVLDGAAQRRHGENAESSGGLGMFL